MKFGSILILFTLSASAQPTVKVLSVVNSASFQSSLPLGGGLATVFCSGLPYPPWIMPGSFVAPGGTSLPYQLDGIAIEVNGGPAPILSVYVPPAGQSTPTQINFRVPAARNSTLSSGIDNGSLTIIVFSLGPGNQGVFGTLAALTPLPGSGLGGFFTDINGNAIAQHADNSLVAVQNPAHPGETITVYGDDFYQVWPSSPVGFVTPLAPLFQYDRTLFSGLALSLQPGQLFLQAPPGTDLLGNTVVNTPPVSIAFQGLTPGMIGVEQINFVVPANQAPGTWLLFFNDGRTTSDGKTIGGFTHPGAWLPVQ